MNKDDPLIVVTVTEADLLKFAPKAKREYVTAILGTLSQMRAAGILENQHRWCHFMGQIGHETGGLRIVRESLHYKSVKQIRKTWPARFKSWSDADMQKLVGNPVALGDAAYGGRMGNTSPGDGCAYRGGGPLQTTGKSAVAKYAPRLGLDCRPELLDDCSITMQFAILEWQESKCNTHADANDLVAVSKAINVGSAASDVIPVNLDSRKEWFSKSWAIWGDKGKADKPTPKPMGVWETLGKIGVPVSAGTAAAGEVVKQGIPAVPEVASKSVENISAWKGIGKSLLSIGGEIGGVLFLLKAVWPYILVASLAGAGLAYLRWRKQE